MVMICLFTALCLSAICTDDSDADTRQQIGTSGGYYAPSGHYTMHAEAYNDRSLDLGFDTDLEPSYSEIGRDVHIILYDGDDVIASMFPVNMDYDLGLDRFIPMDLPEGTYQIHVTNTASELIVRCDLVMGPYFIIGFEAEEGGTVSLEKLQVPPGCAFTITGTNLVIVRDDLTVRTVFGYPPKGLQLGAWYIKDTDEPILSEIPIEEDTDVLVKWCPVGGFTYRITYDTTSEGTYIADTVERSRLSRWSMHISDIIPERDQYLFECWQSGTVLYNPYDLVTISCQDLVLHLEARWIFDPDMYVITYKDAVVSLDGMPVPSGTEVAVGSVLYVRIAEKEGYTGYLTANGVRIPEGDHIVTGDVYFETVYTPEMYSVTYDPSDVRVTGPSGTVPSGSAVEYGTVVDVRAIHKDGFLASLYADGSEISEGAYIVSHDVVFTAVYIPLYTYQLDYDTGLVTPYVPSQTYVGTEVQHTFTVYEGMIYRTGYTFQYWVWNDVRYDRGQDITLKYSLPSATLTAVWQKNVDPYPPVPEKETMIEIEEDGTVITTERTTIRSDDHVTVLIDRVSEHPDGSSEHEDSVTITKDTGGYDSHALIDGYDADDRLIRRSETETHVEADGSGISTTSEKRYDLSELTAESITDTILNTDGSRKEKQEGVSYSGGEVTGRWSSLKEVSAGGDYTESRDNIYYANGSVTGTSHTDTRYRDGTMDAHSQGITYIRNGTVEWVSHRVSEEDGSYFEEGSSDTKDHSGEVISHRENSIESGDGIVRSSESIEDYSGSILVKRTQIDATEYQDGSRHSVRDTVIYDEGQQSESIRDTIDTDADGIGTITRSVDYYDVYGNGVIESSRGDIRISDQYTTITLDISRTGYDGAYSEGRMSMTSDDLGVISEITYDFTYTNTDGSVTTVSGIGNHECITITASGTSDDDVRDIIDSMHNIDADSVMLELQPKDGVLTISHLSLERLSDRDYSVTLRNGKQSVTIGAGTLLSAGTGDIQLIIVKAERSDMTPPQEITVGDLYAVSVRLLVNGVEVHDLTGTAQITIEPGYSAAYVYHVDENGMPELLGSSYDDTTGIVEFEVTHFSIYMVSAVPYTQQSEDNVMLIVLVSSAAAAALLGILLFFLMRRKVTLDLCGHSLASIPEGWESDDGLLVRKFHYNSEFVMPDIVLADCVVIGWEPVLPEKVRKSTVHRAIVAEEVSE